MSTNTLIGRLGILLTGTLLCALTAFAQPSLPAPASLAPTATAATVRVTSDATFVNSAATTFTTAAPSLALAAPTFMPATLATTQATAELALPAQLAQAELTPDELEATEGGNWVAVARAAAKYGPRVWDWVKRNKWIWYVGYEAAMSILNSVFH